MAKYEPDWEEIVAQNPVPQKSEEKISDKKPIEVTENKNVDNINAENKLGDNVEKAPKRKPIVFDLEVDQSAEVNPVDLLIASKKIANKKVKAAVIEKKKIVKTPSVGQRKAVEAVESIPDDDDLIILDQTDEDPEEEEEEKATSNPSIFARLGGKAISSPKPETADLRQTMSTKKNPAFPDTMAIKYKTAEGEGSKLAADRRRSSPARARSRTRSPRRTRNRRRTSSSSSRSSSGSRSPRRDRRRRRSSGRRRRRSRSRSDSRTRDTHRRGR